MDKPFPAYKGNDPYVFVCYAHDDEDVVYPEMAWLHEQGINLWYDEAITPGGEWSEELGRRIDGAVQVVFFVTPAAAASTYCRNEIQFAISHDTPILAVHLEPTELPFGLELSLGSRQAILKNEGSTVAHRDQLLASLRSESLAKTTEAGRVSLRTAWPHTTPRELPDALIGAPIRSIAVLPLENLSGDSDQEYVADGMTEELIGELAKLGSLNVISRTSVMRYKQRTKSIPEIAAELGIDGVLEGTVTREQDRFRVTVQLIDARTDTHLWAGQFDRELSSVLALRSDVARAVAEQIRLELTPEEDAALTSSRRVDPLAYDAYLRGVQLSGPLTLSRTWGPQALEQFEQAVALDAGFAEAWALLGGVRYLAGQIKKGREAVDRALELNNGLVAAHALLSHQRDAEWDFAGARRAAERAIQLSPNDPAALQAYLVSLFRHGRLAEAFRVSERIPLIAPLDTRLRSQHVKDIYYARHYERTLDKAEQLRVLIPDFYEMEEAWAYEKLGRLSEAHDTRIAFYVQSGTPYDGIREARERGWAESGWAGAVRAEIDATRSIWPPTAIALKFASLDATDEAFAWLERGYRERDGLIYLTSVFPGFDVLRTDPRFDDLLRRIGLPETPEDPGVLADVAGALAFAGRVEEAIVRLDKALQLAPDDERLPRWRYYMAMAHFAARRYEQSVSWSQRALAGEVSSNSLAFTHLLLASNNAYLGQLDEAQESLAEALRLWPGVAIKRDLYSLFMAGDPALRDRYLNGLREAGMEG